MKRSLLFSVLLHALALLAFVLGGPSLKEVSPEKSSISVETLSEEEFSQRLRKSLRGNEKQIVQIDPSIKSETPPSEESDQRTFLSSHNQVADRNTRAPNVGKFKNGNGRPEKKGSGSLKNLFQLSDTSGDEEAKVETSGGSGRLRGPASDEAGTGESATDDYLEDVAIGAQTILNAKEYKFYGFYARVREQLVHHWHGQLKEAFFKLQSQNNSAFARERKTRLRVHMDEQGEITRIQVLASAGIDLLDKAAIDAFRLASPFAHPPKQMLNENNILTIRWEFVVVAGGDAPVQLRLRRTGYR